MLPGAFGETWRVRGRPERNYHVWGVQRWEEPHTPTCLFPHPPAPSDNLHSPQTLCPPQMTSFSPCFSGPQARNVGVLPDSPSCPQPSHPSSYQVHWLFPLHISHTSICLQFPWPTTVVTRSPRISRKEEKKSISQKTGCRCYHKKKKGILETWHQQMSKALIIKHQALKCYFFHKLEHIKGYP